MGDLVHLRRDTSEDGELERYECKCGWVYPCRVETAPFITIASSDRAASVAEVRVQISFCCPQCRETYDMWSGPADPKRTAAELVERRAIVQWLRSFDGWIEGAYAAEFASRIERGEHL